MRNFSIARQTNKHHDNDNGDGHPVKRPFRGLPTFYQFSPDKLRKITKKLISSLNVFILFAKCLLSKLLNPSLKNTGVGEKLLQGNYIANLLIQ